MIRLRSRPEFQLIDRKVRVQEPLVVKQYCTHIELGRDPGSRAPMRRFVDKLIRTDNSNSMHGKSVSQGLVFSLHVAGNRLGSVESDAGLPYWRLAHGEHAIVKPL